MLVLKGSPQKSVILHSLMQAFPNNVAISYESLLIDDIIVTDSIGGQEFDFTEMIKKICNDMDSNLDWVFIYTNKPESDLIPEKRFLLELEKCGWTINSILMCK